LSHANARLTVLGRALLVDLVIGAGRPVAHVAKELGISRQCAYRWVRRFRAEGRTGLWDRSSRPKTSPTRTSLNRERLVLDCRRTLRAGPLRITDAQALSAAALISGTPNRLCGEGRSL
jgi:transposase-like protein